jgi:predicted transcriptional regulator YdeE
MNNVSIEEFKLTGISLLSKTTNENGQSAIDCGNLWQQFEKGNCMDKIPGRLSDEIVAVYYDYEGDHTKPFSYFIGCKVADHSQVPEDFKSITIPAGKYEKIVAKGKMPDCMTEAWKEIWNSDIPRAYQKDFEIYDERSRDWKNSEVTIFISKSNYYF